MPRTLSTVRACEQAKRADARGPEVFDQPHIGLW